MATARKQAATKTAENTSTTAPKKVVVTFASAKIGQQISIGKINRIEEKNGARIIHAINDAGFASNIEGEDSQELV